MVKFIRDHKFQVSIARMLAAVGWFACSFAVWYIPLGISIRATAIILSLSILCGSIALGTLFGNYRTWVGVGGGIAFVILILWFGFILILERVGI